MAVQAGSYCTGDTMEQLGMHRRPPAAEGLQAAAKQGWVEILPIGQERKQHIRAEEPSDGFSAAVQKATNKLVRNRVMAWPAPVR
mmetsp:Transcript_13557/g.53756  ORF Transcript_13557/g.53756 Transcript_13557/m.53756 type:complete len:85 (-) Transcript_13557:559-813(-)